MHKRNVTTISTGKLKQNLLPDLNPNFIINNIWGQKMRYYGPTHEHV